MWRAFSSRARCELQRQRLLGHRRGFRQAKVWQGSSRTPSHTPTSQYQYEGPMAATLHRLKIFSLSSLGLSSTLAPLIFILDSSLALEARLVLMGTALVTSGGGTALIGWMAKPYVAVARMRPQASGEANGHTGGILEMHTSSLLAQPRITRIYDRAFLVPTGRSFATIELAPQVTTTSQVAESEETVAETFNKKGDVVGRWIVKWEPGGVGLCRGVGSVVRYFNIPRESLPPS